MLGTNHILVGANMIFVHVVDSFFLPTFTYLNSYPVFCDLTTMANDFTYKYESGSNMKWTYILGLLAHLHHSYLPRSNSFAPNTFKSRISQPRSRLKGKLENWNFLISTEWREEIRAEIEVAKKTSLIIRSMSKYDLKSQRWNLVHEASTC